MNRGARKLLTAFMILATLAGIAFAVWLIRQDEIESAVRQETVDMLTERLKPLTNERAEWKKKDQKWKKKLDAKIKGESCMLISIDNMDKNLYDTIYMMLAPYGMKATFSLKGGHTLSDPEEKEKDYLDSEQFQEMQEVGWEYAVSAENAETDEESDEESEEEPAPFLERLDAALQGLDAQDIKHPKTVFLNASDSSQEVLSGLQERGFTMASVVSSNEVPVIADVTEGIYQIDSALLNQDDTEIEQMMDKAAANSQSMAVSVNNVVRISKDGETDVSLTKFSSFVNRLRIMEEQGLFRVMTYSEFYDYQKQRKKDIVQLEEKYRKFRSEMQERIAQIDEEEQNIVDEMMETE